MNKDRLKREIVRAVTELGAAERPAQEWLVPLGEREPDKRNHFVLFMKPELLAVREGAKLGPILDLISASLRRHGVETGAIRVLNGPYLARHKIMEEHYGVINRASRLGRSALSPTDASEARGGVPGHSEHPRRSSVPRALSGRLGVRAQHHRRHARQQEARKRQVLQRAQRAGRARRGSQCISPAAAPPLYASGPNAGGVRMLVGHRLAGTPSRHDGRHRSRPRHRGLDSPHVAGKEP